jgi:lipoyl(octanoyl) transferase
MISVIQLGTVDYATGLRLQQRLVELRKAGQIGDVLLLLEHTPVITLGRNAKAANVVASPELLARRGVEVFECDRGGDVTFHGPGQIVGYPIFDLRGFPSDDSKRPTLGVVEYVRRLEEVLIRTCADFGISTQRIPGLTGVWTFCRALSSRAEQPVRAADKAAESRACPEPAEGDLGFSRGESETLPHAATAEAKIAALGVHISRGVTSHGFALNVNTDLSFFDLIIPCGIESKPVTSIEKELGKQVPPQDVAHAVSRNFGVVFESQILWLETLDALLGHSVGVPMKPPTELRQLHKEDDSTWA